MWSREFLSIKQRSVFVLFSNNIAHYKTKNQRNRQMNIGFRWFLVCLLCLRVPWGRTKKGSICKLIFSHQKNISNDYRRISEWLPKDYWHIIMSPFRPFGLQIDDSCGFVIKITLRHEEIIALWSIFIRVFFLVCYLWKFRLVPSFCNFLNKMNDFLSFLRLFLQSFFDMICVALYLYKSAKTEKW